MSEALDTEVLREKIKQIRSNKHPVSWMLEPEAIDSILTLIATQKEAWQDSAVQLVLNDVNDTLFFSTTQPSGQFIKDTITAKLDEIEARNIAKQLKKGGE
jgi:hypothetical protein